MKCPVCNTEAPNEARFCQHCGAKLELDGGAVPAGASGPSAPSGGTLDVPPVVGPSLTGRRRATDVPEETLWEGSYSPKAMLGSVVLAAVISLLLVVAAAVWSSYWPLFVGSLIVLWIVVGARLAAKRLGIHYRLTNQMFYHQRGVLNRITNRVEAIDIDDVTYEQGPFDRMVDVGKITITSSDRSDPLLRVEGVEHVQQVAQMIDKAQRAERIRRGVSVESI